MKVHDVIKSSCGPVGRPLTKAWLCVLLACMVPATTTAAELKLLAISETEEIKRVDNKLRLVSLARAMVYVDGQRRILAEGETSPEGVTLVNVVDSAQVVVESDGQRNTLKLNVAAIFPGTPESATAEDEGSAKLWADPRGFFYANGTINGYPVRFLVDTGATIIAIDRKLARRIGLDYSNEKQGFAETAGGATPMVATKLSEVSVGDITLRDVPAGIMVASELDTPLLGMSFLGQLDMVRTENQMELKRRDEQ
jgi:aspartyl protease family protein